MKTIKERVATLADIEMRSLSPTGLYEHAKALQLLVNEIANAPEPEPDSKTLQFLTDVLTAAGLLRHGKKDAGLATRIADESCRIRQQLFSRQPEQPADLEPSKEQIAQLLNGIGKCLIEDSASEFLRVWIRDWTVHKLAMTEPTADNDAYHNLVRDAGVNTEPDIIDVMCRFAALVAAEEREACAKICDNYAADRWNLYKGRNPYSGMEKDRANPETQGECFGAEYLAYQIRSRSEIQPELLGENK